MSEPAWTFRGTTLPGGEPLELHVVSGRLASTPARGSEPLPGRFALTGLVDAHCHLTLEMGADGPLARGHEFAAAALARYRASGVLAVRDVGGTRRHTLALAGRDPGRVQVAGRFLAPAGRYFPAVFDPVAGPDLVDAALAEVAAGARWVKVIADFSDLATGQPRPEPTFDPATLATLVTAVHSAGARVAAHTTTDYAAQVVATGVDSIEHGLALGDAGIAQLGARGGAWTPTVGAALGPPAVRDRQSGLVELWRHLLPAALAAGVVVLTGSDLIGSVAGEVAWLVELGLTPEQALAAATTAAREYLELPAPARGEPVDLVTYDADPRSDPEVLAHPAAVLCAGERLR